MVRFPTPMRQITERDFPHRIDIEVPGSGLGERFGHMTRWLDAHVRPGTHHRHRRIERSPDAAPKDFARFLFLDEDAAESFRRAWGGRKSTEPRSWG